MRSGDNRCIYLEDYWERYKADAGAHTHRMLSFYRQRIAVISRNWMQIWNFKMQLREILKPNKILLKTNKIICEIYLA